VPEVSLLRRLAAVAVFLGWLSPGALALGTGIHLALDHSDSHRAGQDELADVLAAVTHGHHHDHEIVPEHGHGGTLEGPTNLSRPLLIDLGVLPASAGRPAIGVGTRGFEAASRRGPPPLFRAHCTLLL